MRPLHLERAAGGAVQNAAAAGKPEGGRRAGAAAAGQRGTLKVRDSSRKRRFSVGTKPARKMLMPSRTLQHDCRLSHTPQKNNQCRPSRFC